MKIKIKTKKMVIRNMFLITLIALAITILFRNYWPIIIAIGASYLYYREFYPRISIKRAKKMIGENKVLTKEKFVNCSIHSLRSVFEQNQELSIHNKDYRWFLSSNRNRGLKVRVIGDNCFFVTKDYCHKDPKLENKSFGGLHRIKKVPPEIVEQIKKEQRDRNRDIKDAIPNNSKNKMEAIKI
jgi:hypothetical protein